MSNNDISYGDVRMLMEGATTVLYGGDAPLLPLMTGKDVEEL